MIELVALSAYVAFQGSPPPIAILGSESRAWFRGAVFVQANPGPRWPDGEHVLVLAQPEGEDGGATESEIRLVDLTHARCVEKWELGERIVGYQETLPEVSWRAVQHWGVPCIAYNSPQSRGIKVLNLATGEQVASLGLGLRLDDALEALQHAVGTARLLCSDSKGVSIITLTPQGAPSVRQITRVSSAESLLVACFARGDDGSTVDVVIVAVDSGEGRVALRLFGPDANPVDVHLGRDDLEQSLVPWWDSDPPAWLSPRLKAIRHSNGTLTAALAFPAALSDLGLVAIVHWDSNYAPTVGFFGRASKPVDESMSVEQSLFGASMTFIEDMDGDGLPDLAVGAPAAPFSTILHIVSGADGHELTRWSGAATDRVGSSACWLSEGRLLLAPALQVHPRLRFTLGRAVIVDLRERQGGEDDCLVAKYFELW